MGHMLHSRDEPRMQSVTHSFFIKEILQILLGVFLIRHTVSGIRLGPLIFRTRSTLYIKDKWF